MPTSLVTGGAGFLGSHLTDALLARGHRVICVDNLETGNLNNIEHIRGSEFVLVHQDIIEPYFVDEHIEQGDEVAVFQGGFDHLELLGEFAEHLTERSAINDDFGHATVRTMAIAPNTLTPTSCSTALRSVAARSPGR